MIDQGTRLLMASGRFRTNTGTAFGGQYVAPGLLSVLDRLSEAYRSALSDPEFLTTFDRLLADHVGRPTSLTLLESPGQDGAAIFLKREDLTNSGGSFGASVLGQSLLALRMGLTELVCETGSGDHGVAVAATAARLGLAAKIFIADQARESQRSMVDRMLGFGATVVPVAGGESLLHHAMSGAIQYWMAHSDCCQYVAGAPIGPHPYPEMVRYFQSAIGKEARAQLLARTGILPAAAAATMDGGGLALGLFTAFLDDPVDLVLIEPGGPAGGQSAAPLSHGRPGVLHGSYTMVLQDDDGQLGEVRSIAPGTAYPGSAPELAALVSAGRVTVELIKDEEAIDSLRWVAARHGILISIEAGFALAYARRVAVTRQPGETLLCAVNAGGLKDLNFLESTT